MCLLPAMLRRKCPGLPSDARRAIESHFAAARNEWVKATTALVTDELEAMVDEESDEETPQ